MSYTQSNVFQSPFNNNNDDTANNA